MFTRRLLTVFTALGMAFAASAQPKSDTLVFAVNEGVTYTTGVKAFKKNYKTIADDLARLLKTKVRVDVIGE